MTFVVHADKDDHGAFRFSDPKGNVMITITDLSGLSEFPVAYGNQHIGDYKGLRQKPDYSVSARGQQLWGTHAIYGDDLVHDTQIFLSVN
jgi:hypothetical protein